MWAPDIYLEFYNSFFIIAIVVAYFVIPSNIARQLFLLVASYSIYWMISGRFAVLVLLISTVDFLLARLMALRPGAKRVWLTLSILSNLSVLFYFKYLDFFLDQFRLFFSTFGYYGEGPLIAILAPVGISFIVFHGMSYTIDSYRGTIRQSPPFLQYLLYICYFPKILSGPITRATEFIPQLVNLRHISLPTFVSGGELVVTGLFKKIVLASLFAQYWNELHALKEGGPLLVYAAGSCYGLFLLADFSGYTDIARGVSQMLGIELARNFNQPYGATSISEFWRRWHMSLSFWLRDYLYFPLGGSKRGTTRTVINLLITMILCGLWHGAAWTFVMWGLIHGTVMSVERIVRDKLPKLQIATALRLGITSIILSLTWILFASADFHDAQDFLRNLFDFHSPIGKDLVLISLATIAVGPLASYFGLYGHWFGKLENNNALAFTANTIMIVAIIFQVWRGADVNEFVYFRF
jgi:alginate O-acetyltransferase complex protein AlgI